MVSIESQIKTLVSLFNQGRYVEGEALAHRLTVLFPLSGFAWKVLGVMLKLQGKSAEALEPMQRAAELLPRDAEAHYNLGVTLQDRGRLMDAEASYRRALEIKPDYAEAHFNLGNTLQEQSRLTDAEMSFRRALQIKPDYTEAHFNLGNAFKDQGRLTDAEASYRRALQIKPDYAEAHINLGNTLKDQGRLTDAEISFRRALQIKPDYADAHINLGNTLKDQGRLPDAEASYRRVLEIRPDYAEAHINLGNTLNEQGRLTDAEASYRQALEINPDCAVAYYNLGNTLKDQGRLTDAEASYRRALEIKPDYAEAHYNLGNTLKDQGRLNDAETGYRRVLEIKPDYVEAHNNLGATLKDQGRLRDAEISFRRALEIKPDYAEAHGNLLFVLNYTAGRQLSDHLEEACRYGQMVARKVGIRFSAWQCMPRPERLRVGLVSGDLRNHPVGYFLESVLSQINSFRIELIAYPTDYKVDELTARIKPYFSAWKSLVGQSDEAAARLIHADGVHVLLDLSGHTAKNRLPIFAWKPAPVQASWLGYFATTGVAEMDFLLGDPHNTPVEEAGHFTETLWRLPESYLCFTPPDVSLEVGPLPALSSVSITFGCFNNLAKMNDAVVALWTKVLHAIPHSRLFLKTRQLNDLGIRDITRQRFAAGGINSDRLLLEGGSPRAEYLKAYNRVDIALDPFPFPGGTTSVEGLWMGVPVITRRGNRFLSHQGESIVNNAGLVDWIAENDDDYVAKAVMHATNPERLAALRTTLRQQVLASPLCDAPRFARHIATALWGMWEQWQNRHN